MLTGLLSAKWRRMKIQAGHLAKCKLVTALIQGTPALTYNTHTFPGNILITVFLYTL